MISLGSNLALTYFFQFVISHYTMKRPIVMLIDLCSWSYQTVSPYGSLTRFLTKPSHCAFGRASTFGFPDDYLLSLLQYTLTYWNLTLHVCSLHGKTPLHCYSSIGNIFVLNYWKQLYVMVQIFNVTYNITLLSNATEVSGIYVIVLD